MANYESLKSAVRQVVRQNGNNEITGTNLQSTLVGLINSMGSGYQFKGIADTSTNPGTPDEKVFYMTATAGTYSHFGGLVVNSGELAILYWDSSWHKSAMVVSGGGVAGVTSLNDLVGAIQLIAGTGISISKNGQNIRISAAGVSSLNDLTGAIRLVAGSNVTITKSGQNITIAATGSGSAGVSSLNELTGALTLVAGDNVTITKSGSNIIINSTGGGGTAGKKPLFVVCARRIPKENFGRTRTVRVTNSPVMCIKIPRTADAPSTCDTLVSEDSTSYTIYAPVWNYLLRNNLVTGTTTNSITASGTDNVNILKSWLNNYGDIFTSYIFAQAYFKMSIHPRIHKPCNAFINDGGGIIRATRIEYSETTSENLIINRGVVKCVAPPNGYLDNINALNVRGTHYIKMRRTGWASMIARKHPGGKRRIKWRYVHKSPQAGIQYVYTKRVLLSSAPAAGYTLRNICGYFTRKSAKFRIYRVVRKRISDQFKEFHYRIGR